jgi:hypothetical protein
VFTLTNEKVPDFKTNKFGIKPISWQIIIITIISAVLAGIFYYYRTNYLTLSSLEHDIFRAVRMTCVYVLIPFGWAWGYKKVPWKDFGLTRKKFVQSLILGIAVYSIALVAFLLLLGNPEFDKHFRWGMDYPLSEWLLTLALVSWMAFVTDLWTRGFVLMQLAKHQSPAFGILAQNITWLGVHIYEILLLGPSMGILGALGLTLVLGVLGDVVALKTKNIIGLGIGHIFLNLAFLGYIRFVG